MSSNANRTTENEVGLLSKLVTTLHTIKAQDMLKRSQDTPEGTEFIINTRDVAAMGKWVLDNGMTMLSDADNAESELAQALGKIKEKSKVLDFKADYNERGIG